MSRKIATVSDKKLTEDVVPEEMTFLGILGIRDDIRPEAVKAIEEVMTAGIQVWNGSLF